MTEHVHDYVIEGNVWRCRHCPSELDIREVYIRIKATERVSAKQTNRMADESEDHQRTRVAFYLTQAERDALRAYADILEGKST